MSQKARPRKPAEPFAGRWVAKVRGRIVGQGGTPRQALLAAKVARPKEIPQVEFVPWGESNPLKEHSQLPEIVQRVRSSLPEGQEIYLVGGAVRDLLLGRKIRDFDFLVAKDAIKLGRRVADALGTGFYPLDISRDFGRVLIEEGDDRLMLDFIRMQGKDIEEDLLARDVTINAMAIDLRQPDALLDPCGGAGDLLAKRVKACSPTSFSSDPVRIVRAVRMSAAFGMKLEPETRNLMKAAVGGLASVSPERLRDEFMKLLATQKAGTSMQALDLLGALEVMFPEIQPLRKLEQPSPHAFDVWGHTLHVLKKLDLIFELIAPNKPSKGAVDLQSGLLFQRLGRYRREFAEHLQTEVVPDHSRLALLYFATLFHDAGKATTQSRDESGRIHFYEHENVGAQLAAERSRALHLSNHEVEIIETIVRHHGRPYLLTKTGELPSRRAIYRFFRDTQSTGGEVCLLSLADFMAKFDAQVPQDELQKHLATLRALLEAYFEHPLEQVSPPALVNGEDLMRELGLQPGPEIGEMLEAVREAQAAGEVTDRQGAMELARRYGK